MEEENRGLMMRRSLAQVAFLPSALSAGSSEVCTQMAWVPFLFLPINFFLSHRPRLAIAFKKGEVGFWNLLLPLSSPFQAIFLLALRRRSVGGRGPPPPPSMEHGHGGARSE